MGNGLLWVVTLLDKFCGFRLIFGGLFGRNYFVWIILYSIKALFHRFIL